MGHRLWVKTNVLALIVAVALVCASLGVATTTVEANAAIEISSAAVLYAIRNDTYGNYVLTAHIDLTDFIEALPGKSWVAVPYFFGGLDGSGHTITGLKITGPGPDTLPEVGLFRYAEGNIANVHLAEVSVTDMADPAGALANSLAGNGRIENCTVTGTVTGGSVVGGMIAWTVGGTVVNSHANVTVESASTAGELVSSNTGGHITDSSAEGNVKGKDQVGCPVGKNNEGTIVDSHATGDDIYQDDFATVASSPVGLHRGGTIRRSHATGRVEARYNVGGLAGSTDAATEVMRGLWHQQTGRSCWRQPRDSHRQPCHWRCHRPSRPRRPHW